MILPDDLSVKFKDQLAEYEEERRMKYVTSIERHGIEKGMQLGIQKGSNDLLLRLLQQRFGALEETIQAQVRALPLEKIEALSDELFRLAARADLEAWLARHPHPSPAPHEIALAKALKTEPDDDEK